MTALLNITGLILAGGAGRRVGGRDKGLLVFHGRPLVAHVVQRLRPQVGRLLISCNRNLDRYRTFAELTAVDIRRNFQGPLAGLEAAIPSIETEFLLLCACDTPLLPADLASRLMNAINRDDDGGPADICYVHDGEREQYLCAMMRCSCLPSLREYLDQGNRSVHKWFRQQRSRPVDFSGQHRCFRNLNQLDRHGVD